MPTFNTGADVPDSLESERDDGSEPNDDSERSNPLRGRSQVDRMITTEEPHHLNDRIIDDVFSKVFDDPQISIDNHCVVMNDVSLFLSSFSNTVATEANADRFVHSMRVRCEKSRSECNLLHILLSPVRFVNPQRSFDDDFSFFQLCLRIIPLQGPMINFLFDMIPDSDSLKVVIGDSQEYSLSRAILRVFRFCDSIVDMEHFVAKFLGLFDRCGAGVLRDSILCFPEIIRDPQYHDLVVAKFQPLMVRDSSFVLACFDSLSHLVLSPHVLNNVRETAFRILRSAPLEALPVLTRFLLQSEGVDERIAIRAIRRDLDLSVPLEYEGREEPFEQGQMRCATYSQLVLRDDVFLHGDRPGQRYNEVDGDVNQERRKRYDTERCDLEVVLLESLVSSIQFRRSTIRAVLGDIRSSVEVEDHFMIDLWILFAIHGLPSFQRAVESLFRMKVCQGMFTTRLVDSALCGHARALLPHYGSILSIAEVFIGGVGVAERDFGVHLVVRAFESFASIDDPSLVAGLLWSVLGQVGSSSSSNAPMDIMNPLLVAARYDTDQNKEVTLAQKRAGSALEVLVRLTVECPRNATDSRMGHLLRHVSFFEALFDHMEQLNLENVRTAYAILSFLSYFRSSSSSHARAGSAVQLRSTMNIVIRKQLRSLHPWVRERGVIGAAAAAVRACWSFGRDSDTGEEAEEEWSALALVRSCSTAEMFSELRLALKAVQREERSGKLANSRPASARERPGEVLSAAVFELFERQCISRRGGGEADDGRMGKPAPMEWCSITPAVFTSPPPTSQQQPYAVVLRVAPITGALLRLCVELDQSRRRSEESFRAGIGDDIVSLLPRAAMIVNSKMTVRDVARVAGRSEDVDVISRDLGVREREKEVQDDAVGAENPDAADELEPEPTGRERPKESERALIQSGEIFQQLVQMRLIVHAMISSFCCSGGDASPSLACVDNENERLSTEGQVAVTRCMQLVSLNELCKEIKEKHSAVHASDNGELLLDPEPTLRLMKVFCLLPHAVRSLCIQSLSRVRILTDNSCSVVQTSPPSSPETAVSCFTSLFLSTTDPPHSSLPHEEISMSTSDADALSGFWKREVSALPKALRPMLFRAFSSSSDESTAKKEACDVVFPRLMSFTYSPTTICNVLTILETFATSREQEDLYNFASKALRGSWRLSNTQLRFLLSRACLLDPAMLTYLIADVLPTDEAVVSFVTPSTRLLVCDVCGVAIVEMMKHEGTSDSTSVLSFSIWVRMFQDWVNVLKARDSNSNLALLIKHGRAFLICIVNRVLPFCDARFDAEESAIMTLIRSVQTITRFLHSVCAHSKVERNERLMKSTPALKRILERFVWKVKKVLVSHESASKKFWLGNLKHKNLSGQIVQSQIIDHDDEVMDEELEDEDEDEENSDDGEDEKMSS